MNLNKICLLVLLLAQIAACAPTIKDPRPFFSTAEEFWPYIQYWESLYKKPVYVTVVGFGNPGPNHIAVCRRFYRYRWVEVSKEWWEWLSPGLRKALILHELGHCEANKMHNDNYVGQCPASVMSTYLVDDYCWDLNWQNYESEFLR